ncbi:hypothetical protein HZ326_18468, partial [Fusarium oxysporum f. sp. albedinis]
MRLEVSWTCTKHNDPRYVLGMWSLFLLDHSLKSSTGKVCEQSANFHKIAISTKISDLLNQIPVRVTNINT